MAPHLEVKDDVIIQHSNVGSSGVVVGPQVAPLLEDLSWKLQVVLLIEYLQGQTTGSVHTRLISPAIPH